MSDEVDIGGVRYISSKRASELSEYSQDYIGQLARAGSIDAKRVSGLWYVSLESLQGHKEKADTYTPVPPKRTQVKAADTSVSFDGHAFISAAKAAKITGYHSDYVAQLAREGKVLSKQVGNRWHVSQDAIRAHKREKDSLLAAVQVASVGLKKSPEIKTESTRELVAEKLPESEPIRYFSEQKDLLPVLPERAPNIDNPSIQTPDETVGQAIEDTAVEHKIAIRVVEDEVPHSSIGLQSNTSSSAIKVRQRVLPLLTALGGTVLVGVVLLAFINENGLFVSEVVPSSQYASVQGFFEGFLSFMQTIFDKEITFVRE